MNSDIKKFLECQPRKQEECIICYEKDILPKACIHCNVYGHIKCLLQCYISTTRCLHCRHPNIMNDNEHEVITITVETIQDNDNQRLCSERIKPIFVSLFVIIIPFLLLTAAISRLHSNQSFEPHIVGALLFFVIGILIACSKRI